jgi:hypothetical protein
MSRNRTLPPAGRLGRPAVLTALALALAAVPAAAQQPGTGQGGPHLLRVQPPGGRAGTTVEITVVGRDLAQVRGLYFSQPGLRAELVSAAKVDEAPATKKKRRGPRMGPMAGVRFRVHIPADTPVGAHDLRVITEAGISNARAFVIGDVKEYVEKEPNNDVPQAQRVELNCAVHGAISNPTDVDYFRFAGRKGQRVVLYCAAAGIDSQLEPAVELYGPDQALLALGRGYNRGEALCDAVLPADGDYDVRVCSFGYVQGGPDYFYRLSISTAPWIDAVFPPVVEPGKKATVTVYGRNLPGGTPDPAAVVDGRVLDRATVTVDVPADPAALQRLAYGGRVEPASAALDGFELRLRNDAGTSNPFLLTYALAPVVLDAGGNDSADSAQEVPVPCEIAGRIETKNDRDWYAFQARKGDTYSIELYGARLGSPVDLQLSVRRADNGRPLAELDDNPEVFLPQVLTRTDDPPRYRFAAPADGRYLLRVTSTESYVQAGPRHLYRLRVSRERPDFRLVAFPPVANALDACVVPEGGHQLLTLLVWRQDGFTGPIRLTAEGLPEGVTCRPQEVPPGSKLGFLVLSAAKDAPRWAGEIRVRGEALVGGKEVVREARAAGATWPVPIPQVPAISRLDRSLVLAVGGPAAYTLTAEAEPKSAVQGQRVTVPVRLVRNWPELKGRPVQVAALALPPALGFQQFTLTQGKDAGKAVITVRPNAQPGTYTVVLRGQVLVQKADKKTKRRTNLNVQLPSTPITVTVLPKALARLSVPGAARVKAGEEVEVRVKVARLYGYGGPFTVQLVLPPDGKGLEAEEVTIPAGKNEARLVIRADPDARPGPRPNLVVRAVAMFNGKVPTKHEARINVVVAK